MGFRNPDVLCKRVFERSLGGPGTYELFDYKDKKDVSIFKNVGFGTGERFHSAIRDETLPPGYKIYSLSSIWKLTVLGCHDIKTLRTKFTKIPTFEWDGLATRFKISEPPYRKAPNRYNLPPTCITDKVVSKRGPYDTFTGPRDQTTIKNHFAPPLFKSPDTIYNIPSEIDHLLHHPNKKRFVFCENIFY